MKCIQPIVTVEGDNEKRDMARHGGIVGISHFHVVWTFGFLPDSEYAETYGVSTPEKLFVLSNFGGEIKDTFLGDREDLPRKFTRVINSQFIFARSFTESNELSSLESGDGLEV